MSALCFMLIKEEPVYELELAPRRDEASARAAHLVLHGALDLVDRAIAPASAARAQRRIELPPPRAHRGCAQPAERWRKPTAAAAALPSSPPLPFFAGGWRGKRRGLGSRRARGCERLLPQGRRPARVRSCGGSSARAAAERASGRHLFCAPSPLAASCWYRLMSRLAARA